jgi:hypothetical protein
MMPSPDIPERSSSPQRRNLRLNGQEPIAGGKVQGAAAPTRWDNTLMRPLNLIDSLAARPQRALRTGGQLDEQTLTVFMPVSASARVL